MESDRRSRRLGYALAAAAAVLWSPNGSLARFLLDDHMPPARLAELRSLSTFVLLAAGIGLFSRRLLRVRPRDVRHLAVFGVVGLTGVTAFYFAAIARLQIGVVLSVQYLGPLLLLVWLKLVHGRRLARGLWGAAGLSAIGCFLVVRAYDPGALDAVGLLAAFGAAVTFAVYLYSSEQAGHRCSPATTLVWGFGVSSISWLTTQPIWSFPTGALANPRDLAFAAYVAVGGTLIPFACIISAVRHLPASRAAVVATLEPVLGALLAWPIHDRPLAGTDRGGPVIVGAVIWVQSQRPQLGAELAPAYGSGRARRVARRHSAVVE